MNNRFIQSWLFAGVGVTFVAIALIAGAFAFAMYSSSGDATEESALGPGRIVFTSDRDGDDEIYVMNADGSGVEQLTDNDFDDRHPSWSPDGERIVFQSDRGNDTGRFDLYVINADGSGEAQLTAEGCGNHSPVWSPDGERIAFTYGNVYVMDSDGSGVEQLTGYPRETCAGLFWWDPDGDGYNEAYIRKADGSVELVTDRDPFQGLGSSNWHPSWSPDGERIVFQSDRGNDTGRFDLYVMNADGSDVERLTDDEHSDWLPSWSPDGGRIVFQSDRGNKWFRFDLYVMNADGSGVERLTENEHSDYDAVWSPDGGRIAFSSQRDNNQDLGMKATDIYVMNADGSGVVRLTENEHSDSGPAWSPRLE